MTRLLRPARQGFPESIDRETHFPHPSNRMLSRLFLAALLAAAMPAAAAQQWVRVRGRLLDARGRPEEGSCLLSFRLAGVKPAESWTDSIYVQVLAGEFEAVLGKDRPISETLLAGGYVASAQAPAGTGWQASVLETSEAPAGVTHAPAGLTQAPAATPHVTAPPARPAQASPAAEQPPAEAAAPSAPRAAARKPSKPAAPAPEPLRTAQRLYEVQDGDTLQSVAAKLWGDPSRWAELYEANADRLARGGDLEPGQKLIIPEAPR